MSGFENLERDSIINSVDIIKNERIGNLTEVFLKGVGAFVEVREEIQCSVRANEWNTFKLVNESSKGAEMVSMGVTDIKEVRRVLERAIS